MMNGKVSDKSALRALLLCIFFGCLGIHRFYVGKALSGFVMLLTIGGFGIWLVVDLITIAMGAFRDKSGAVLQFQFAKHSRAKQVAIVVMVIFISYVALLSSLFALTRYLNSNVVNIVEQQLSAIKHGDMTTAYDYTSTEFQRSTSRADFSRSVDKYSALKNYKDANLTKSFTKRSTGLSGGTGVVSGEVQGTNGEIINVTYTLVKEGGEWKISNMKVTPEAVESDISSDAAPIKLPNVYESKENKYSIHYPADWEYSKPDKATVVIGGKAGSPDDESTVNIQAILTKKVGGKYANVDEFLEALKAQAVEQFVDTVIVADEPIVIDETPNSIEMKGRYMVFTYTYHGVQFKQMQFVFERGDEEAFYTWAYTSPINRYLVDYPIAKAMFSTWAVH